jgi:hypothetical protein
VTQQARLLVGLAIVGAIPLTLGAILWLVGTVMGAVYHGHWSGTAGLGGVLLLAGLLCGLALFLLAAAGERWAVPEPWALPRKTPRELTPLASPEQQALLADPPPPPPLPARQFPPDGQWPGPEPPPPPYPTFRTG